MNHILTIHNLGPIHDCCLPLDQFTVLVGPQSSGKSTIAKAVYFFRSVKQDILQIMMQGGPASASGNEYARWDVTLKQRMREKFLQLFGTSWVMPSDMSLNYVYGEKITIDVCLTGETNYVDFRFSEQLQSYLQELEHHSFTDMNLAQKEHETKELNKLFSDNYETVFVPAGRNLITLLSTQLNYIFTSLEGSQLRNIDYITKRYTELILKLKPYFSTDIQTLWDNFKHDPDNTHKKKRISPEINRLLDAAKKVLQGSYRYVDGEERLYLDQKRYVKINLASSGQQEIVWVFNLLYYFLFEEKKIFLIIEEPESHLYPESQRLVAQVLSLFSSCGNPTLVTTHSPYVLGTFNYLLLAAQSPAHCQSKIKAVVHKREWLPPKSSAAYLVHDGNLDNILFSEDNLLLIENEVIDGAATQINRTMDEILTQICAEEG